MPVKKVKGGYKWGSSGKVYPTKAQAERQASAAYASGYRSGKATGGESKVNEAGNYTKPTMRKRLFEKIKAGSKGGKAGEWSARKAQMLAKEYKDNGGGYK